MSLLLRLWPYLAGVALIAGAWALADHRGYQRGYARRDAIAVADGQRQAVAAAKLNDALAKAQGERDDALNARLDTAGATGERSQTIILKETASAPRYSDPVCGLTVGVFDAINDTRRLSHRTQADGSGGDILPTSPATGG